MARRKGPSLDRAQVVEAAIRCVEAEGPEALGVSRVAQALGIKPPSIYNHVGKGDALGRQVVIEGYRRLLLTLEDAVRGVVEPREQLLALAEAVRGWARAHPHLYELMARGEPPNEDPEFQPILVRTIDLFSRPLGQLGLREDEHLHAIRSMRAALQGFLLLENRGQFRIAVDSGASYRWLVETLVGRLGD